MISARYGVSVSFADSVASGGERILVLMPYDWKCSRDLSAGVPNTFVCTLC